MDALAADPPAFTAQQDMDPLVPKPGPALAISRMRMRKAV